MIRDVADPQTMGRYVTAVRRELAAGAVDDDAARAAQTIRPETDREPKEEILRHLPDDGAALDDEEGPFLSHDPVVSLLQTSIDEGLRQEAEVEPADPERDGFFERVLDRVRPERFGPDDPRWITRIAKATLGRLADGNHPFNPEPAEYEIADDARLVIVGDWGTGLQRAQHVARHMGEAVAEATAQGREAHVIHLGDVYYSGVPAEYDRHVLADGWWPVTTQQSQEGVTSWSLVGNHDMYSGGWGFFEHLLADPRFQRQYSPNGQPTSWFRLKSRNWTIAGLDTSWNTDVVSKGTRGVLEDPQASRIEQWADEPGAGKLMLLSHHQYVTIDDPRGVGEDLQAKVAPLAKQQRITAWLWGHEHRCIGYATDEIPHMRCIGHGGVPVPSRPPRDPLPPPAIWEVTGSYEADGQRWGRFGFAVLDFAGDRIDVTYRDDAGAETHRETIS
jgi:hypothetical protein